MIPVPEPATAGASAGTCHECCLPLGPATGPTRSCLPLRAHGMYARTRTRHVTSPARAKVLSSSHLRWTPAPLGGCPCAAALTFMVHPRSGVAAGQTHGSDANSAYILLLVTALFAIRKAACPAKLRCLASYDKAYLYAVGLLSQGIQKLTKYIPRP